MRVAVLTLCLLCLAAPAAAHRSSMSYLTVRVEPGQLSLTVQLATRDLYEALALERDRDASDAEVLAGRERLAAYVGERLGIEGCPLSLVDVSVVTQADRFARLEYRSACTPRTLILEDRLFFDLDPGHVAWVDLQAGERHLRQELRAASPRLSWDLAASGGIGSLDFVSEGLIHIFTGFDHLAFVVALLLVAVLGPAGSRLSLRLALTQVLKTITAFTVAHSLTLIAAALGWLTLPSRLVESAIALSIVVVAVENLVRPPRSRWPLALGFGLVHGLGFASALAPLLPPTGRVLPLLAFNLGVELGQLAVVAVLLPLLFLACQRAGVGAYRRWVVTGGSLVVAVLGLMWLVERALDLKILPALG